MIKLSIVRQFWELFCINSDKTLLVALDVGSPLVRSEPGVEELSWRTCGLAA